jgi:predicted MPP superfamily phosphohydrolase
VGQAVFLVLAITVVTGVHYYLWRRLVRDTTRTRRARRLGTGIVIGLVVLVLVTFIGSRVLPHSVAEVLAWPGYLWLAVMFYLILALAVLEIPARVIRRVRRPALVEEKVSVGAGALAMATPPPPASATGGEPDDVSRRLFLARAVAITAGVAATGIVASGVGTALGPPRLSRVQIPLAKLPRSADGYRVALVSDIHLGPLSGFDHTRRIVDMINGMDADIVTIVGDLVDGSVAELGPAAAPLRDLRSKQGAYFVTGNHEYYSGVEEWIEEIRHLGVRPLRNERVELPAGLDLAGVNDATAGQFGDAPDYDRALAGRDPGRAVIMLAHQPIQADEAAARGVDLQLSGHTHGGQMVPFNLIVRLAQQPVVSGLGEVDGMPVYVTNGAGFWGPPVRVGAPPDITLVELRSR